MTILNTEELNYINDLLSYEVDYFEYEPEIDTSTHQTIIEMINKNNYEFSPEQKAVIVSLLELEENESLNELIEKLS